LQIRTAEPEDLQALVPLMRAFSEEVLAPLSISHIESALAPLLQDEAIGDVWVVEEDVITGYLVITWGWGIESGGREALIDEIYVMPKYRGQGLASALVKASLEKAKALDTKAVFLETEAANPESRLLYERLGFKAETSVWMRCLLEADD
jgi:ribosomal protein S18 acetylase RimI-like enzyme